MQRSLPDSSLTSKLDEGDQNDWKQMNDEDLVQYEREEMDGAEDAEDAELANLPGEQGEQNVTRDTYGDN